MHCRVKNVLFLKMVNLTVFGVRCRLFSKLLFLYVKRASFLREIFQQPYRITELNGEGGGVKDILQKTRLSFRRMIWLLPHRSPRPATHGKTEKKTQLADGREGMGEEPNHTTAKNPGPQLIIQYSLAGMILATGFEDLKNWK